MGIKSGFVSIHTAGTAGPSFESTSPRQYVIFNSPYSYPLPRGGQMSNDRVISFPRPNFSASLGGLPSGSSYPSGAIHVFGTGFAAAVPGLSISGNIYAPLAPYAIADRVSVTQAIPAAGWGVRVGLWDSPAGGTYLEDVQFYNPAAPFTQSTAGAIDFNVGALAVIPA